MKSSQLPIVKSEASVTTSGGVYFVQLTELFGKFWTLLKRRWLLASMITMLLTACLVVAC
jgi:hypothetical protein